jgi:hypothetical protein
MTGYYDEIRALLDLDVIPTRRTGINYGMDYTKRVIILKYLRSLNSFAE